VRSQIQLLDSASSEKRLKFTLKKKNQYVPINLSVSEYKPCAVHKGSSGPLLQNTALPAPSDIYGGLLCANQVTGTGLLLTLALIHHSQQAPAVTSQHECCKASPHLQVYDSKAQKD